MSANPTPHPLDAAARDELARKAEAARDAWNEYANPSSRPANDTRMDYLVARDEFKNACSPDVILALLASVRGAEADSKRLDWMQEHAADVEAVMDMDPEAEVGFRVRCYDTLDMGEGDTLRAAIDAARAHPPTEEPADAES